MKRQYIITDPCYIIPDEDWATMCAKVDSEIQDRDEWTGLFLEKLRNYFSNHGIQAAVDETGFGDWVNEIRGLDSRVKILQSDFAADSGLVCVVESTPEILTRLQGVIYYCYAILEADIEPITVDFDKTNPHWTVVRIGDNDERPIARSSESNQAEF